MEEKVQRLLNSLKEKYGISPRLAYLFGIFSTYDKICYEILLDEFGIK